MAISVADNFSYQGTKPLDARSKFSSISEMVSYSQASLYDGCISYVTAEKKYYSYDSHNAVDPTTGKWREFSGGGGGGGLSVDNVTVTHLPNKTSYIEGDNLDLTGMTVTARAETLSGTVTSNVTTVPSTTDMLLPEMTSVAVNYYDGSTSFNISVSELTLTITTLPDNTGYIVGEALDLTGIVVTGSSGGSSFDVTSQCTFSPVEGTILSQGNTTVEVHYRNKTQTFTVTAAVPQSLEITQLPTNVNYGIGGALDLTGIEVTATAGQIERDIASLCTYTPPEGTEFDELGTYTITASYMGLSDTFQVTVESLRTMTVLLNVGDSDPTTRGSYTDDAAGQTAGSSIFDEFFGFYPVLMQNGVEVGRLDPDDFSKFEDGTEAPITTAGYDVMIFFPRRGYKISKFNDGSTYYDSISITKEEDIEGYCYYPFVYKGDACDGFYIGAYESCLISNQIYSLSGQTVCTPNNSRKTMATIKTLVRSKDSNYEFMGFYQFTYICLMLLIKYRGQNPKVAVGKGVTERSEGAITTCGATDTLGMFYGDDTGTFPVKIFGLENFWGNYPTVLDGIKQIKTGSDYKAYSSLTNDYSNDASFTLVDGADYTSSTAKGGAMMRLQGNNACGVYRGVSSGIGSAYTTYLCYGSYAMSGENTYGQMTGWWNGGASSTYASIQIDAKMDDVNANKCIRLCQFKVSE